MAVRFVLNGKLVEAACNTASETLLGYLRASGRTGTKEGCAEGECGACAVALVREDDGEGRLLAVNSCLLPLSAVAGRAVISVEGVADGEELHAVQEALVQTGGSQCGYCTPGFVMSMFCEYYRPGRVGFESEAISGNLCRCTGYRPILDTARLLPEAQEDNTKRRLCVLPERTNTSPPLMRPRSLSELWQLQAQHPHAKLMAGGTDLMVDVNLRGERFDTAISLESVAELRVFHADDGQLKLGAALTLSELERLPHGVPLLTQLLPSFASRLIRNRATLGGNLGTASPIGDAAPVLLALDAQLSLASAEGTRTLPIRELFTGYRKTSFAPGELLVSVRIPRPLARYQRFYKVSKRAIDDISTVAAAFALDLDDHDSITHFKAAFGGIAATPLRALDVEPLALGRSFDHTTVTQLAHAISELGTPLTDARGSAAYRKQLLGSLLEKLYVDTQAEREERSP